MAGDVLRGLAGDALGEGVIVAALFFGGKLAVGVRVEMGAIAGEREHQKQLGIHSRGGDVGSGQARDGGGERWFQLHSVYFNTEEAFGICVGQSADKCGALPGWTAGGGCPHMSYTAAAVSCFNFSDW